MAIHMLTNRTKMALFAIAISSSIIVVSSLVVSSAFAATGKMSSQDPLSSLSSYLSFPITVGGHKSSSPTSEGANTDDSSAASAGTSSVNAKDLKKLSKCESSAATDGDLTISEVNGCYSHVF
jgi:hypothetical protein